MLIGDGQWIAVPTIAEFELTFEVGAPDIVGGQCLALWRSWMTDAATVGFALYQAVGLEEFVDGGSCGQLPRGMSLGEYDEQLFRTP